MPPQRMPLGNTGMVEVLARVMSHADLLHHPSRAQIGRYGEGYKRRQIQRMECVAGRFARTLGGQPLAPELRCQPPADLDTRRKVRLEHRNRQPYKADEARILAQLNSPRPESMPFEVVLDALDQAVTLVARQRPGKKLHHLWIAVHPREGLTVRSPPSPKHKALRLQCHVRSRHCGYVSPGGREEHCIAMRTPSGPRSVRRQDARLRAENVVLRKRHVVEALVPRSWLRVFIDVRREYLEESHSVHRADIRRPADRYRPVLHRNA